MKKAPRFSHGSGLLAVFVAAFIAASGILLGACTSGPTMSETAPASESTQAEVTAAYSKQIEQFSDGEAEYSGFYNNFEYKATLLNTPIRTALLQRQNQYYQWDRDKFTTEREKSEKEQAVETAIFLSFYTPDHKNDNLVDKKSIWRIYLEAGGHRYEGKVKRLRSLLSELQTLYPYHTRWNTPYLVTFPVSTTAIETQASTVTVTGPLGTRVVKFSATR